MLNLGSHPVISNGHADASVVAHRAPNSVRVPEERSGFAALWSAECLRRETHPIIRRPTELTAMTAEKMTPIHQYPR
jgi:hypothetical protein